MPVAVSRSISPYVVNNHHRNRLSRPTSALQCVFLNPCPLTPSLGRGGRRRFGERWAMSPRPKVPETVLPSTEGTTRRTPLPRITWSCSPSSRGPCETITSPAPPKPERAEDGGRLQGVAPTAVLTRQAFEQRRTRLEISRRGSRSLVAGRAGDPVIGFRDIQKRLRNSPPVLAATWKACVRNVLAGAFPCKQLWPGRAAVCGAVGLSADKKKPTDLGTDCPNLYFRLNILGILCATEFEHLKRAQPRASRPLMTSWDLSRATQVASMPL
jgi:hypothetical protein